MTTRPELTEIEVALKDLVVHDLNARAGSAEAYEADDIPVLAASIATLGLLNPLIVQKTGKHWGVIAGGRRRAALLHLAGDKSAKGWTMRSKVTCRAIADDVAAATAITVAENVTQKAMDPLDEFEAFARMMETGGHSPESIATMFGVERRRVVDRLRFGRIHPEIRAAARAKDITLDAMKAFAEHPDQEVQAALFREMQGQFMAAWAIRDKLRNRGVKIGDALGQLVVEGYRAAGGEIAADLIEEDGILTDEGLVETLLMETLHTRAEEERARLGLKWAAAERSPDYEAMRAYGRVYPQQIGSSDAADIADRMAEIEELRETDESVDPEALDAEWLRLDAEYGELTNRYAPEDLARAGVIATWERGEVTLFPGLVRPEDKPGAAPVTGVAGESGASEGGGTGAGASGGSEAPEEETGPAPLALSESLKTDLKTEQAAVVGSALAADPALAQDLALFKIVADMMGRFSRVSYALGISAAEASRPHAKPEGVDGRAAEALEALHAGLDLSWWDERSPRSLPERFERFRALDTDMKARIVAYAMAGTIQPTGYGWGEELLSHVARQIVPEMRAAWRPTGEAFFGRLKKGELLGLLAHDLKQPEEAARLASGKKSEIVDYLETLFAAPFATLSPAQREAVETWCPPGMEIPAPKSRPGEDAEPDEDADDGFIDEVPFEDGEDDIDLAGNDEADGEEEEIDLSDADATEPA